MDERLILSYHIGDQFEALPIAGPLDGQCFLTILFMWAHDDMSNIFESWFPIDCVAQILILSGQAVLFTIHVGPLHAEGPLYGVYEVLLFNVA